MSQFKKKYGTFYTKNCHKALKKMALGSEIRKRPIPDPGSRIQGSKRHRIPDPQHCFHGRTEDFTVNLTRCRCRFVEKYHYQTTVFPDPKFDLRDILMYKKTTNTDGE